MMKHLRNYGVYHRRSLTFVVFLGAACALASYAARGQGNGSLPPAQVAPKSVPGITVIPKSWGSQTKPQRGQRGLQRSEPDTPGCRFRNRDDLQLLV